MSVPEEFDYAKNMNYVAQGFKAGPFFDKPNLAPAMVFGSEEPLLTQKLQGQAKPEMAPVRDAWVDRK